MRGSASPSGGTPIPAAGGNCVAGARAEALISTAERTLLPGAEVAAMTCFERWLGSPRLTLGVLSLIIAAIGAAAAVPQGLERWDYFQRYGSWGNELLERIRGTDVFHSAGFAALLALLGGNCLIMVFRWARRPPRFSGATAVYAGVLILLLGVAADSVWGWRGMIPMQTGEVRDYCYTRRGAQALPFRIALEDSALLPADKPVHQIIVLIPERRFGKIWRVAAGREYPLGAGYALRVAEAEWERNAGDAPDGRQARIPSRPSLDIQVRTPSGREILRLAANCFEKHCTHDGKVELYYQKFTPAKEYVSQVRLAAPGQPERVCMLRSDRAVRYSGYVLHQARVDEDRSDWTEIEVHKQPGMICLWTGAVLLNGGLLLILFCRRSTGGEDAG